MQLNGLSGFFTSLAFVVAAANTAFAQQPQSEPDTRQTMIVHAADEKAQSLHPYEVTFAEKVRRAPRYPALRERRLDGAGHGHAHQAIPSDLTLHLVAEIHRFAEPCW